MIPTVGSLQKHGEEFLPLASVDSIREESYDGKKRDFSRRTIVLGTVVPKPRLFTYVDSTSVLHACDYPCVSKNVKGEEGRMCRCCPSMNLQYDILPLLSIRRLAED